MSNNCVLTLEVGYPIINSPRCGLSNGSIEVVAVGTGQITYQLNNGPEVSTGLFENLNTGSYTITIRDEVCEIELAVPLQGQENIELQSVDVTESDCGQSNGSITVHAEGSNLEYSLNDGSFQASNQFSGLSGNNYRVNIRDANDCIKTENINVPEGSIVIHNIQTQHTNCTANDGSITVNAEGDELEYRL